MTFTDIASFYLVEKGTGQYLMNANNEFITTNELTDRVDAKIVVGNYLYKKG